MEKRKREANGRFAKSDNGGTWKEVENLEGEVWADIENYEGRYQVSNLGRVRNAYGLMRRAINSRYEHVTLRKDGKVKTMLIHRLVARAFIPNPDNLPIINHKDEDKHNNKADNLEWCDHKYNLNYGTYPKRNSETRRALFADRRNNWRCKKVRCNETGAEYISAKDAKESTGIDESSIMKVCKGIRKSAGGFTWSLIEAEE